MTSSMESTSSPIKCLVVLSGIPGCGKSTLATLLNEKLITVLDSNTSVGEKSSGCSTGKEGLGVVIISYDDLIPEDIKFEESEQQSWKEIREEIVMCVEVLLKLSSFSLDRIAKPSCIDDLLWEKFYGILKGHTPAKTVILVIDDNMYYTSMRYRYFQLARKYICGFCQIALTCSVQEAQQRNNRRNHPISEEVIATMATKIEKPNSVENSWETNSIMIDSQTNFESHLIEITDLVMFAIRNPVQPLDEPDPAVADESRQICATNVLHQCDQILRKIVSQKMSDLKDMLLEKQAKQILSKKYLEVRRLCLERLKTGRVAFPMAVNEPNISSDQSNELYLQIVKLFEELIKEIT